MSAYILFNIFRQFEWMSDGGEKFSELGIEREDGKRVEVKLCVLG